MFEDSEEKKDRGSVRSYLMPVRLLFIKLLNLDGGNKVDDDRLPYPKNKTSPTGDTEKSVYKEGWKWSGIHHRRAAKCRRDVEKLDGMN